MVFIYVTYTFKKKNCCYANKYKYIKYAESQSKRSLLYFSV